MKQTFKIPEGCEAVTIEQVGDQLITTFEPLKQEFKRGKYIPKVGDCVKVMDGKYLHTIGIVHDINEYLVYFEYPMINSNGLSNSTRRGHNKKSYTFEQLTPEQFQSEFEKLGYIYDFETHTAEKKRWRAKDGCSYYIMSNDFEPLKVTEIYEAVDNSCYETGNYFQTSEQAEKAAEFLKQQLKEYLSR